MQKDINYAAMDRDKRRRARLEKPLLLILLLCALTSCGLPQGQNNQVSSATVRSNQQMLTEVPGAFTSLHTITTMIGWAVSWDLAGDGSYLILRTTDGGETWTNTLKCKSSLAEGKGFFKACSTDFHSSTVATVVEPESADRTRSSQIRIFHTSDGGTTWQDAVLQAQDQETPATFIDAVHGWALVTEGFPGPDPGSTYIGKNIALEQTSDGGKTWTPAAQGPSTSQSGETNSDAYGIAPLTADTRMSFVSTSTGWLSGNTSNRDGTSTNWLYETLDGGKTWRQAAISITGTGYNAPVFFSALDGAFSTSIQVDNSGIGYSTGMFYTTHDGGQTWHGQSTPFDISMGGMIDSEHGWAPVQNVDVSGSLTATSQAFTQVPQNGSDGLNPTTLDLTADGWQHWREIRLPATFKRFYGFDFVSPTIGWAFADNQEQFFPEPGGGKRKGDIIVLLKTSDGGQSWQQVVRSQV